MMNCHSIDLKDLSMTLAARGDYKNFKLVAIGNQSLYY